MPQRWEQTPMVALDLEGSGSQDHDDEAILEIALVPMAVGRPALDQGWHSLVNPGRRIPRRPWTSPGLTNEILAQAPPWNAVEPAVRDRVQAAIIVGHNVRVDWRLLHRRSPRLRPAALLDTLRLARYVHGNRTGKSLTALLTEHRLTEQVNALVPDGQPHRALWDTVAVTLLLPALIAVLPSRGDTTMAELVRLAGVPMDGENVAPGPQEQLTLGF
ncbi:3'-5' exonuclease [Sphaerimonospora thailandensis]|uniref:Exonuclease domain-containing protein n=1 Tax=Sphaerimonospora thailandensis TaxID=795644 RepID=A0A8J3VYM0_9ACTN|nr:3'-5' exonuclease [Sphaerimonospora thailandensis]GIH69138.1 hypothetical protein Mth01_13910 [Sphaerimonospora thailandensis]